VFWVVGLYHLYMCFIKIFLASLLSTTLITADYTYFDYDKLVFGNAGGFEMTPSTDGSYYLQVLNLGTDENYISKAFYTDGKMKSVLPATLNVYDQSDLLEFGSSDEASFDDDYFDDVPTYNDSETLPTNKVFFVGELLGEFMLLNDSEIEGITQVSGNNFETTDIYLQEDNGSVYIGLNTQSEPVLSIYPDVDDVAYVGINTTAPAEALTVSGDLYINGNIDLETPLGVFESYETEISVEFDDTTIDEVTLASYEFTIPPYATQNVMIISMVSGQVETNFTPGAWFHCWMEMYTDDNDDGVWDLYDDPLADAPIANRSYRSVDGSLDLSGYHVAPQFSALLEPSDDGTERTYRVDVIGTNSTTNALAEDFIVIETVNINIMGLPYSTLENTFQEASVDAGDIVNVSNGLFENIDGNFYTNQIISFGSGGAIIESGENLVFTDGSNYLDFRASELDFGSFHYIDSLKVYDESTDEDYPFTVGTSSKLGVDSYNTTDYYGGLVSANIQTLDNGNSPDTSATLNFLSDIHIGDTISIETDGQNDVNVEIGSVVEDTSLALNVDGNILFTGTYTGSYGHVKYQNIDGQDGTSDVLRDGYIYDDSPDDYIILELEGDTNWNVMGFAQMSANVRDSDSGLANYMWIIIEDQSDGTQYISQPTTIFADNNVSHRNTFYNAFTQGGLPSGTYHVYLKMQANYTNYANESAILDSDNDGDYDDSSVDFGFTYSRLTGCIGTIATPGN